MVSSVRRTFPVSILLLVAALCSCGGGGGHTCAELTVTYAGSKSGPAYLRMVFEGANGGRFSLNGASVEVLTNHEACWTGGQAVNVSFVVDAWIDVSGASASPCADVSAVNPDCKPAPGDPMAHQTGVIPYGDRTNVVLAVTDPP